MARATKGQPRESTRDDVARLAGVSTAVVSYVVNNGPRPVAPATRERVLEAIEKLGYRPNTVARSLITGRSGLIGLIVPDVENPYFASLARSVESAVTERGLRMVLAQSTSETLGDLVDSMAGHLVDGIITATLPPADLLARSALIRVPLVKVGVALPTDPIPAVWPDFEQGTRDAVRHLIEVHGHRTIALVTGGDARESREAGWREVMAEHGLATDAVVRIPWSAEGGHDAAFVLRDRFPHVTAAFVASDQQATGLLAGLHRIGWEVPGRLALASFDGSLGARFTIPPLTTAAVPLADMARDAVEDLLGAEPENRSYSATLVVRESCGCAPAEAD